MQPTLDGYVISVNPNNTDEERSGTITFYAAVSQQALDDVFYNGVRPSKEKVVYTTVLVKQEKGEKKSPIFEVNFYMTSSGIEVDRGSKVGYGTNFDFEDTENATITCVEQGRNLHVECIGKIEYSWQTQDATLSFDIQNYKDLSSDDLKIINMKWHYISEEKYDKSLESLSPLENSVANYLRSNIFVSLRIRLIQKRALEYGYLTRNHILFVIYKYIPHI